MTRTLIVMVKEPRPGRVKTRLGRDLGLVNAAWWFRHQSAALLRRVEDPRWQVVLAVAPDREGLSSRVWPAHLPRWPQGRGDLGDRMARMMRLALPGPVCVIGADIPGISRDRVWRAFQALGQADAVFGPAMDGGYWLVGMRNSQHIPQNLFANVRWSSEQTLADTLANLAGCQVALVDQLRDVDTVEDLTLV
ncbi:TIGR04282 family arsenosugar biosynthesis glycosyltransferase [Tropicibacter sp. R15_0]|uniref:TIGR04282 family arsenosugar biosynthesis glycosyltransferase n=1 Tax=Tropicibacter sp. R15_0 TaxID=2821101 RepID=UPI001AD9E385|nr:TIGR04282 family arsenosugar biosynthesis glycosyltransferase [Tropicibacter sp. R15_0]MBO9467557.1 TIGR04282 family arsenosugar biosynthesis glycosyltransferase [Tropicibacter sp. R15_0]